MLIETIGSFSVGQKLTLSFALPDSEEQVKMKGEIVRVLPEGKFAVQFAIEDENAEDETENEDQPES